MLFARQCFDMKEIRNYGPAKHICHQRLCAFSKHKFCNVGIPDIEALILRKAPRGLMLPLPLYLKTWSLLLGQGRDMGPGQQHSPHLQILSESPFW